MVLSSELARKKRATLKQVLQRDRAVTIERDNDVEFVYTRHHDCTTPERFRLDMQTGRLVKEDTWSGSASTPQMDGCLTKREADASNQTDAR